MPRYLWVKWEDSGPRAKRFKFSYKLFDRKRVPRLAEGFNYVVFMGKMGAIDLQVREGLDPEGIEDAVNAFVNAEGGQLSEYWVEVGH